MIERLLMFSLEKGWGALEKGANTKKLRQAVRARLARETRFNLELWQLSHKKMGKSLFAEGCRLDAIEEVCSLSVPISLFFDDNGLNKDAASLLVGDTVTNENYKKWAAEISNEVDLIERVWHRLQLLKIRHAQAVPLGDVRYACHLLRGLDKSLRVAGKGF